jgi:hypothetical protein
VTVFQEASRELSAFAVTLSARPVGAPGRETAVTTEVAAVDCPEVLTVYTVKV